jgi:hypothetical protein
MKRLPTFAALLVVAGLALTSQAMAETWKARLQNILDKSPRVCATYADADGQIYTFELVGNSFTVSGATGKYFTITIPADGSVNHEFKSPKGGRFAIVGNAISRTLEFHNLVSSCKGQLVPM